jgi:microcystin-dependent protein
MSEVITPVTVIGDSAIGGTATVDSGDISVVAGNLSAIDIVSNNIDSVVTDANNIDSINTLAASNSQLLNLNSNLSTIETVNSKLGEINRYYTTFLGSSATDPTVRVDGSPLQVGDMYYSTTMPGMKVRGATAWATSAGGVPVNNSTLTGNTSIQNLTVSNAFNANGYAQFNSSDAFKIPSGTTAQRPSPVSGQLRFNITTGEFEGFNGLTWGGIGGTTSSGGSAGSTAYVRQTFTATAGQTTFTITGGYTPGKIDVFKNGIKLVNGSTVTVTNGASVVLSSGATVGDIIDVVGLASGYFDSPAQPRRLAYTATAGQTLFNVVGGYTPNQLDVFQNGTKLVTGTDVDVSSGTTFTLVTPATAGDTLEIVGFTAADTIAGTLKFQAGTAAAPSITTFEDTNTGIFFPAADTIAFAEGGAEAMRIDSSGNVGVGGTLGVTGLITATGGVAGAITGNVTGNVSGTSGSCTGNAATATALATGRTIAMTGDVSYTSASFNGTENVSGTSTLASSGVTAGTYGSSSSIPQITVDAKGRITSATSNTAVPVDLSPSPAGTYGASESTPVITVNSKGQVTSATTVATQIPVLGTSPAGTYGSSTQVPSLTVNSRGQVTGVTNTSISFPAPTVFLEGMMMPYAGSTAPSKWLLCDGSAISRTTYPDLFAAISTTFGAGNGSTTFNVPDMRGRTPIGVGTGAGLTARTTGSSGGAETVTLTDQIGSFGSHSHTYLIQGSGGSLSVKASASNNFGVGTATTQSATVSGSGASHTNMQPFLSVNFIIYSGV